MITKNKPEDIDPGVFATDEPAADSGSIPTSGFSINFAAVADPNEPVTPGVYNATIVHAEPAVSKASGNPMINLRWRIDDDGDMYKRVVFDRLVFAEKSLWYIRMLLTAIGYSSTFNGEVNHERLIGESATITVIVQAGNGINLETQEPYGPKNAIKKITALGTGKRRVADLL